MIILSMSFSSISPFISITPVSSWTSASSTPASSTSSHGRSIFSCPDWGFLELIQRLFLNLVSWQGSLVALVIGIRRFEAKPDLKPCFVRVWYFFKRIDLVNSFHSMLNQLNQINRSWNRHVDRCNCCMSLSLKQNRDLSYLLAYSLVLGHHHFL